MWQLSLCGDLFLLLAATSALPKCVLICSYERSQARAECDLSPLLVTPKMCRKEGIRISRSSLSLFSHSELRDQICGVHWSLILAPPSPKLPPSAPWQKQHSKSSSVSPSKEEGRAAQSSLSYEKGGFPAYRGRWMQHRIPTKCLKPDEKSKTKHSELHLWWAAKTVGLRIL